MSFSSISRIPNLEIPLAEGFGEPLIEPLCSSNLALSEIMLTFAPGELSTLAGGQGLAENGPALTSKSFNLGDLPCPPQSVMVGLSGNPYVNLTFR